MQNFFMRIANTDQTARDAQADLSFQWAYISNASAQIYSKIRLLKPLENKTTPLLRLDFASLNGFSLLRIAPNKRDNIFLISPHGYSLKTPHRGASNEYSQHIFCG